MSAHLPVLMAARRRYPASGQEAERAAFVAGIAVCQKQAAAAMSAAIESPDPFPALRSLLSALSQGTEGTGGEAPTVRRIVCWKGREPCPYTCDGIASGRCAPVAHATEPGPTERVDVDLRYQYDGGVFVVDYWPDTKGLAGSPNSYDVRGLSVRITYCFSPADREAAEDVAAVWEARLRERGAKRVEMVGEETER